MLLPPLNLSMAEVSRREGVSEMSLSNWRKQLSSEGSAVSENKQSAQNWSAETKFAVVLEASGLSEIDLGEYCRRKDKALAETAALLVLRKKLNDYWGSDNEDN